MSQRSTQGRDAETARIGPKFGHSGSAVCLLLAQVGADTLAKECVTMRLVRRLSLLAACLVSLAAADPAAAQFAIGGDPRVNPNDFRITTFTSGLNFPTGMVQLSDGSILIATSNPTGSYFNSSGTLLRFVDANGDGVADGPGQVMYTDPVGVWTDLRVAGNLVFVTSAKQNAGRITILRMNNGPAAPYTAVAR